MADDNIIQPVPNALEQIEQNAETNANNARLLAEQDNLASPSNKIDPADTSSALDKLLTEKQNELTPEEVAAKVEADKAAAEAAAAAAAETPEQKAAREAAETERIETEKRAEELFKDAPQLAPNASPKSAEAFKQLKITAAQEISKANRERDEAKTAAEEAAKKAANPLTPEIQAELEDHRKWRAKLDVDADPRWKGFDQKVASTKEFIYAQLRKSPAVTEDIIKKIEEYGGPDACKLDKLWAEIKDPTLQRIVESKIADMATTKFEKEQAVKTAKENIQQYITDRSEAFSKNANAHNDATKERLDVLLGALEWVKPKPVDAKFTPEQVRVVEDHNKFVAETQATMQAALKDDSPQMRAIMISGMGYLFQERRERAVEKAIHAETQKTLAARDATIKDLNATIERMKAAGTNRMRLNSAPAGGTTPAAKPVVDVNTRPGDALDAIAAQVIGERQAKLGQTS